jgi:chromosome segregation ATPase
MELRVEIEHIYEEARGFGWKWVHIPAKEKDCSGWLCPDCFIQGAIHECQANITKARASLKMNSQRLKEFEKQKAEREETTINEVPDTMQGINKRLKSLRQAKEEVSRTYHILQQEINELIGDVLPLLQEKDNDRH